MNAQKLFIKSISEELNCDSNKLHLYWKGRVALYAILQAMSIKEGDEIILPGFTCVVVPNAIKYLNAIPIYVDIEKDTLNSSFENIKKAVTKKTKVIICQNSFGLSSDIDLISEWARENGIFTIEDCTHGFGGTFNSKFNGSFCDAAFYSTQWNKPFSTAIGGILYISNNELNNQIKKINSHLLIPNIKDNIILKLLLLSKKYILNKNTYWVLRKLYRFLSKYNIVIGSSGGIELESTKKPDDYFKGMSFIQSKEGIKSIKKIKKNIENRISNANKYTNLLKEYNCFYVREELFKNHSFLKYPILVKDRVKFERIAEENKIELGDWFCSPIHPVVDKNLYSIWDLHINKIPNSNFISYHIVNLSTDGDISNTIEFIKKYNNELI